MTVAPTSGRLPLDEAGLAGVVTDVMDSFVGSPVSVLPRATRPATCGVVASVSITGAWSGVVLLTCSPSLARAVTGLMLDRPVAQVSADDVRDAVGELANMVGGSVKALAPEPSRLSLPRVTTDPSDDHAPAGARLLLALDIDCSGDRIGVAVLAS